MMIAIGVPSRPRKPSQQPGRSPMSSRKATPTTTVGSTKGTSSCGADDGPLHREAAAGAATYAAGRPSATRDARWPRPEVHSGEPQRPAGSPAAASIVEHGRRIEAAPRSHSPRCTIAADRQHEEDRQHRDRDQRRGATRAPPAPRPRLVAVLASGSLRDRCHVQLRQPRLPVARRSRRGRPRAVDSGLLRELRPVGGQLDAVGDGEDVHRRRQCRLHARRESMPVDRAPWRAGGVGAGALRARRRTRPARKQRVEQRRASSSSCRPC